MAEEEAEDLTQQLVVQLPMGITEDDLDLRNGLGDAIGAAFARAGLGDFDGADIGSGTMNLFAYVPIEHWEQAFATVRAILAEKNLLDVAIVARRLAVDAFTDPTIVWPEGHPGQFTYY